MKTKANNRRNRANRVIRYPGIVGLARELGVTRIHLYRVLTGERRSPRIERHPAVDRLRKSRT